MKSDVNGAFSFLLFTCCTRIVADIITVLVDEQLRKLCSGMVICNVGAVMQARVLVPRVVWLLVYFSIFLLYSAQFVANKGYYMI